MTVFGWLISASWLALVGYWCVSGAAAVRHSGCRWRWWREIALRLGFFALVVLALQVELVSDVMPNPRPYILNTSTLTGWVGFVLATVGIGFAIAGRDCLRFSWTAPIPSEKRTLVTGGPYAFVRHPIYGGFLLAMLGSAIGQSALWLLPLIVYAPGFLLSARREEHLLIEEFAERYRDYMRQTKMFLPFVL